VSSYLAYGPLLNRAVSVVFEGVPTHPTPARSWEIIDKLQVGDRALMHIHIVHLIRD